MTGPTLAITENLFVKVRVALALKVESAWAACGAVALDGHLLLINELTAVADEHYRRREALRLDIASPGYAPAFAQAADAGATAIPLFLHTHPSGRPVPSRLDHRVDEQLRDLALTRTGRPAYASVIFGGTSDAPQVSGRVWLGDGDEPVRLDRLRVAGPSLGVVLCEDRTGPGSSAVMFDRQVRAFGQDGQHLLAALKVGVVGAGGTGSATIEQLARLGVGQLVIVDDDTIDETNLTRIHQSRTSDVDRLKVDVAGDAAGDAGTATSVTKIAGKVMSVSTIRQLASCDVVFGCTDDHAGRMVLSRLAYHYLVPVIDCGVVVDATDGRVRGVHGRVTVACPGHPCLVCRGQVDLQRAAAEQMDPEEYARRAADGYVPDIGGAAPAVVAFTTAVAAAAVGEMLGRLFDYAPAPHPGQLLIGLHDRTVKSAGRPADAGHYCQQSAQWGLGDTSPPLGISGIA